MPRGFLTPRMRAEDKAEMADDVYERVDRLATMGRERKRVKAGANEDAARIQKATSLKSNRKGFIERRVATAKKNLASVRELMGGKVKATPRGVTAATAAGAGRRSKNISDRRSEDPGDAIRNQNTLDKAQLSSRSNKPVSKHILKPGRPATEYSDRQTGLDEDDSGRIAHRPRPRPKK